MKSFMWALLLVFFCAGYGYAGFKTDNKPVLNHEKGRIFTGGKPNSHLPLPPHGEKAAGKHKKYKEDELLVKFKAGISENSKKNLHKKYGSEKIKGFPSLRIEHVKLKKGMSVDEAVKLYKADSGVEYAEPNYLFTAQNVPGDPRFNELWGLYNTGQTGGTSGADIKAPGAWNLSTGSSSVVVAVIDTGIDYGHEDLRANVWINQGELNGQAGVDDDGNGYVDDVYGWNVVSNNGNPFDDMGHGTHVAGIIGAAGNNGTGVAGVNWNVKIMACKFLDAGGYGYTDGAVACLQYIKAMKESGVNIVATNNSWGGGGYSQALYDAINAQRDILFIAAAGNNYSDNDKYPTYPANYDLPNVIAVAATDSNDGKAYFSDYGRRTVSVGAPGLGILSTLPAQNVWGITEGYGLLSGTSMATPHVTGLAALINSQDDSRDWRQTRNLILSGGEATASMTGTTITGKRISAYGALACTDSPVFSIVKYPASITAGVPVVLSALSINCSSPAGPVTMTTAGGQVIELHDDGIAPDIAAGDGIFAGTWTPSRQAERLTFSSPAGTETITVPSSALGEVWRRITGLSLPEPCRRGWLSTAPPAKFMATPPLQVRSILPCRSATASARSSQRHYPFGWWITTSRSFGGGIMTPAGMTMAMEWPRIPPETCMWLG